MLILRGSVDPVMGQELHTLGCVLSIPKDRSRVRIRRIGSMDGSESDDEDQPSRSFIKREVKG